ncbi:family 43 glycosylhydrolase [Microbacterium sp. NPDC058062]|uniref:glycoside hydrolase family 43 protein n=1 Tax=Microbacterium sp. NPDC058062 TaxID=3346320 RepID=UPI0036DAAC96
MSESTAVSTARAGGRSGEFQPILPGFYPDPTICRVGDDYYVANSSFEYFPGAPLFHSRDLVNWTQLGNILTDRMQFRRGTTGPSTGIYGSTLRHRDGRFWFITTNVSDFDSGQIIVHAEDPSGPWSAPVFVRDAIGIDPDLCWDDDGTCYLTWHVLDFTVGGQGIRQAPIDLATGRLLEPHYPVWQGSGMPAAEGPHLYKIDDLWYMLLAEGGTERGHCVTAARSSSPRGPFEPCPWNPVLTHRSTVHPVQSVGHADLVQSPDGSWAIVYLGSRPRGSTPGFHVLGRETFLAGVDWVDGWPVVEEGRFEVPAPSTGFVDDFAEAELGPRWVVPDSEPDVVVTRHPLGGLSFPGAGASSDLLCTRVRDFAWTADALFETSGELRLRLDDRHWCAVIVEKGRARVVVQIGDVCQEVGSVAVTTRRFTLRLEATSPQSAPVPFGYAGPDDIALSVRVDEGFEELARLDGRYFSTEVAAGFTGRMLAVGCPTLDGRIVSLSYRPSGS